MANDETTGAEAIERVLEAAPVLTGITVSDAQRSAVRTHLQVGLSIASRIGRVGDEAAPIYRA
jgi:hypothetical protein